MPRKALYLRGTTSRAPTYWRGSRTSPNNVPATAILTEDGIAITTEDGQFIETEN